MAAYPDWAFQPVVLSLPEPAASRPALEVHVLPFGLTIHRLLVHTPAQSHDLIVGPEDPRDHERHGRGFLGPIIGRYANRLPAGKHKFGKDEGVVDVLEFSGPGVSLHGGPASSDPLARGPFDRRLWHRLSPLQTRLFSPSDASDARSTAVFGIDAPHDDNGFPGALRVEARVAVEPPAQHDAHAVGNVVLAYRAQLESHADCSATPLNLTQHWGFNLDASAVASSGQGDGTIDDHQLFLSCPSVLALDASQVTIGTLNPVSPPHDWRGAGAEKNGGKRVATSMPEKGYDHYYFFGRDVGAGLSLQDSANAPEAARFTGPRSGISLSFSTNQTGVQLYTANFMPPRPENTPDKAGGLRKALHRRGSGEGGGRDKGKDGGGNFERSAAMLEFSHPHATFLHPELQEAAGTDTVLRGGETYENWVKCRVEVRA